MRSPFSRNVNEVAVCDPQEHVERVLGMEATDSVNIETRRNWGDDEPHHS